MPNNPQARKEPQPLLRSRDTNFGKVSPLLKRTVPEARGAVDTTAQLDQLTKVLSQIIARSWLPDDPIAARWKEALNFGRQDEIKAIINGVLREKGYEFTMENILGENIEIIVDWGSFIADFEVVAIDEEPVVLFRFPYPPRPSRDELKDQDLAAWWENKDSEQVIPHIPYIPLTVAS